jgi:hypothetical protein
MPSPHHTLSFVQFNYTWRTVPFKKLFMMLNLKSKLIYDRQSAGTHVGPTINFSFSLKFSLDSYGFVILKRSFWREDGSVIHSCCWSSPAQSRGTQNQFCCPKSRNSPNLEGQVPVFIFSRNRVAQIYPRALGSLLSPLTTRRARPHGSLIMLFLRLSFSLVSESSVK